MEELHNKRRIKINKMNAQIAVAREAYSPNRLKVWRGDRVWYQRSTETRKELIQRVSTEIR